MDVVRGGEVYNISRARLLEILTTRARDLGVRIEHGKEVGAPRIWRTPTSLSPPTGSTAGCGGRKLTTTETAGRNKHIWLGSDKLFTKFGYLFAPSDKGWLWAYAYAFNDRQHFHRGVHAGDVGGTRFRRMSTDEALPILERIFADYLDGHRLVGSSRRRRESAVGQLQDH